MREELPTMEDHPRTKSLVMKGGSYPGEMDLQEDINLLKTEEALQGGDPPEEGEVHLRTADPLQTTDEDLPKEGDLNKKEGSPLRDIEGTHLQDGEEEAGAHQEKEPLLGPKETADPTEGREVPPEKGDLKEVK